MSQPFRNDNEEDGEDFNLFVSPSRFSGRTPSAATAKSRVFQDAAKIQKLNAAAAAAAAAAEAAAASSAPPPNTTKRNAQPAAKPKEQQADAERAAPNIEVQSVIRQRISVVNWIGAIIGFIIIVISLWLASEQLDGVLVATFRRVAPLLRTPIYMATALFVGGMSMLIYGAILGAGTLAAALSSGLVTRGQRSGLILYEMTLFLSLVAFAVTLVTATSGLLTLKGHSSISIDSWGGVTARDRCIYERSNKCVGLQNGNCSGENLQDCSGLFCNMCLVKKKNGCGGCERLISEKALLDACVHLEKFGNDMVGCGPVALRTSRIVLVTAVFAAVLGIITCLVVAVVDLLVTS